MVRVAQNVQEKNKLAKTKVNKEAGIKENCWRKEQQTAARWQRHGT